MEHARIGFSAVALCLLAACSGSVTPTPLGPTSAPTQTITVESLKDSGPGSLRAAILALNAGSPAALVRSGTASAVIRFSVSGVITLHTDLPPIRRGVVIDGTTAPAYAHGAPAVELDANHYRAFVFAAGSDGSQLLGLAIGNARGNGVTLEAGSITLNHNYIGLDLKGAALGNRGDGVYAAAQSTGDTIGLNESGASGVVANVISANAGNGVSFHASSSNTVAANRIGTDASGASAIANAGNGIWLTAGSNGNEIGGTRFVDSKTHKANNPTGDKGQERPVFVVPPDGNLISGNGRNGILIDAGSMQNTLNGNFIGTRADGDGAIPNAGDGVRISGAGSNALIGCKFVNNPFVYYNVVSGNGRNGVEVTDSDDVTIQGNFFGIGANNTFIVANKRDGILVNGSSSNTQVGGVIPLGNVSAGNGSNGIEVAGAASHFITFNTFGGLLAFKRAAPNGNDGLLITATGGHQTARTNVFSGNANNGIEIAGHAWGVTVDPDIVGLNTDGNGLLPNGNDGILIRGDAHDNVIGGYTQSVIPENTFSGNRSYGVEIAGHAEHNEIFNSFIGTDVLGTAALANDRGGVYVGGSARNEIIGGAGNDPSQPKRNLISGNTGNGVTLAAGTSFISVIGNWIGLDRFERKVLPNSGHPIVVSPGSHHNTIEGNITSGK